MAIRRPSQSELDNNLYARMMLLDHPRVSRCKGFCGYPGACLITAADRDTARLICVYPIRFRVTMCYCCTLAHSRTV